MSSATQLQEPMRSYPASGYEHRITITLLMESRCADLNIPDGVRNYYLSLSKWNVYLLYYGQTTQMYATAAGH